MLAKDDVRLNAVLQQEESLDILYNSIADYARRLAAQDMPADLSPRLPMLIYVLNNAERLGDHAENIAELGQLYSRDPGRFSAEDKTELQEMTALVREMGARTQALIRHPAPDADSAVADLRRRYKKLRLQALGRNRRRLEAGDNTAVIGMLLRADDRQYDQCGRASAPYSAYHVSSSRMTAHVVRGRYGAGRIPPLTV